MIPKPCCECTYADGRNQPYCQPDCLRLKYWKAKTSREHAERQADREYRMREANYIIQKRNKQK